MSIKNFFRYFCLIFIIFICVFIFIMSAKNGQESGSLSGSVIEFFVRLFNRNFDNLPISEQLSIIDKYQFIVRKGAHFSIYAALGFFTVGFLNTYKDLRYFKSAIFSLIFVSLYATSDEIHQLFVAGRGGQARDVLIDTLGGIFGISIMIILFKTAKAVLEAKRSNEIKKQ